MATRVDTTVTPRIFLTTIAGSLPKPSWPSSGELWAPWLLEGELLAEGKHDAVRLALADQPGGHRHRQRRGADAAAFRHHVHRGARRVDFENKKTVRIRNRYDADVPIVVGPVERTRPIFVEDARFLRAQTRKPVKSTSPAR